MDTVGTFAIQDHHSITGSKQIYDYF